jgi:hypothetical protein
MAQTLKAILPAQTAAGATSVTEAGLETALDDDNFQVNRVELFAPSGYSTVTHHATNNVTFNVQRVRAAGTPVVLASFTGTATDLVAETAVPVPLTGTAAQLADHQRDDNYEVQMVQNASGVAVGAGLIIQIELS